jgi:formylglycine-generating enzyme
MRLRAFQAFLSALPVLMGCTSIAGLNDLEVDDKFGETGGSGGKSAGGESGASGAAGSAGSTGGTAGKGGAAGKSGAAGAAGSAGGAAGASGTAGVAGMSGAAGQSGKAGAAGAAGTAGAAGGKAGAAGASGGGTAGASGAGAGGKGGGGQGGTGGAGTGGSGGSGGAGTGGVAGGGAGGSAGDAGAAGDGGSAGDAGMAGSAGDAGAAGSGACVPTTCEELGKNCGMLTDDGCGAPLDCGTCTAPLGCGDAGVANICGCVPNAYSCGGDNGQELRRCSTDGSTTSLMAHCESGCDANAGSCGACIPGELLCSGQQLQICQLDGTPAAKGAACAAGQYCDPTDPGECDKCLSGSLFCLGTNLRQCSANGQSFSTLTTCETEILCQKTALLGITKCLTPLCKPGDVRCSGAQPQICNATQDGWDPMGEACDTAELCSLGTCLPPVCDPGESKCTNNVLEICNAGRTGFDQTPCVTPDPICDIGACVHRGPTLVAIESVDASQKYWVDATEVTNGQYNDFLNAQVTLQSDSKSPAFCAWNDSYGTPNVSDSANQPVSRVDWCDAYAYCAWAGKRLCGKIGGGVVPQADVANKDVDQWYLACRGKADTAYPYGDGYVGVACNGADMSVGGTVPVATDADCEGGFPGLFDMSGNVAEWEDSCTGSSGANDTCRVRGGSYTAASDKLTCDFTPTVLRSVATAKNIGFRCCAD